MFSAATNVWGQNGLTGMPIELSALLSAQQRFWYSGGIPPRLSDQPFHHIPH
jgi:hypothetical protein